MLISRDNQPAIPFHKLQELKADQRVIMSGFRHDIFLKILLWKIRKVFLSGQPYLNGILHRLNTFFELFFNNLRYFNYP